MAVFPRQRTLCVLLVMFLFVPAAVSAANYSFIEADRKDGSYPALSGANGYFGIWSPYRGSTPSQDSWVNIVGMYNEPRSSVRMHKGVDIGAVEGRDIYPVCGQSSSATVTVHDKGFDAYGYGRWIRFRHVETISGVTYRYDSFYAHMQSESPLNVGATVYHDTPIGKTGSTGVSDGPHLHLEFRTLSATDTGGLSRMWAPGVFYWRKNNSWSLDTSYISRLADSGTIVRFRCRSKHTTGYHAATNVRLYYKVGLNGTWTSTAMDLENATEQIYRKDLSAIAPAGNGIYFYVGSTDTKTELRAYRPWVHSDGSEPREEPFYRYL